MLSNTGNVNIAIPFWTSVLHFNEGPQRITYYYTFSESDHLGSKNRLPAWSFARSQSSAQLCEPLYAVLGVSVQFSTLCLLFAIIAKARWRSDWFTSPFLEFLAELRDADFEMDVPLRDAEEWEAKRASMLVRGSLRLFARASFLRSLSLLASASSPTSFSSYRFMSRSVYQGFVSRSGRDK